MTPTDTVHLLLRPAPAGKPQGQFIGRVEGQAKPMTFRRGGVTPMDRATAEAFCRKYNPLGGDFRGIYFIIQEVNHGEPTPEPSSNVVELQALVTTLQDQLASNNKMLLHLMEEHRRMFAEMQAARGDTVHPAPAPAPVASEAAAATKAKPPKKGSQAMTMAHFKGDD